MGCGGFGDRRMWGLHGLDLECCHVMMLPHGADLVSRQLVTNRTTCQVLQRYLGLAAPLVTHGSASECHRCHSAADCEMRCLSEAAGASALAAAVGVHQALW